MDFMTTSEMVALIGGLIFTGFGCAWFLFWVAMIPYQLSRSLVDGS